MAIAPLGVLRKCAYLFAMNQSPIDDLSDRTRTIFRVVVENYLESGAPVGSRTISKISGLSLSPASIRNVMQDLEELGLLAAPHTSAGRMPTDTGLRLFVDGMLQSAEPSAEEQRAIEARLPGRGPIEDTLAATSAILSELSACAGLVLSAKKEPVLRQFGFVPLSERQALAVIVGADGQVENRVVELNDATSPTNLAEAANYISTRLTGLTMAEAVTRLQSEWAAGKAELDATSAELVRRGLATWSADADRRPVLIVSGQANLIDESAAADIERVRQLMDELEKREEIARLIDGAREAQATKIFIGSENKLFSLSGSSVIAAPYRDGSGKIVGVLGVIGPTRLNYARIVPMVDFTAHALSRRLG